MLYIGILIVSNMAFRHKMLVRSEVPSANTTFQKSLDYETGGSLKAGGFGDGTSREAIPKLRLRLPPLIVVKTSEVPS